MEEKVMNPDCKPGIWKFLRTLGSGGFGQVTLWFDPYTGQQIAVKKLRETPLKDPNLKAKLTERWCNEVEIMKKLNHPNIVSTIEVPSELKCLGPVLAMEYCSKGDLRQVLNSGENCCGLKEPQIINILRDISNGLAYLHSCKIIHRDIKPDNIVLQMKNSNIVYKLIDLGYAKSLDESSLSKSFVGTVQYIAPELFMGKAYTSSVDYWSFGLMTHEIITGYRPFLPGSKPSDWMKEIQNKARDVISVVENNRGEIEFHSKISRRNHSSRCFLEDIEKWLQLALDWDGQTRGRDSDNSRLVIFENLTEIICKKVVKVFSLPTYETLCYNVTGETDISDLRNWLKESTGLEKDNQLLLLSGGKCLSMNGNLFKNLENEKLDRSTISLFLYNSGPISIKSDAIKTPKFIEEILQSPKNLPYKQLKKCYTDSLYFIISQANNYRNLLKGVKVKITNTKQKTLAIESLYEDLLEEWNRIENYNYFMSFSHKIDLENYIYYRKAGKLKSSFFVRKWIKNAIDVNNKITELKNSFNKTKQNQLMLLAKQRCRTLDDQSCNDVAQKTPLDNLVEKGEKLWENLQKSSKTDREIPISNESVVELVSKAIEETNKFVNSKMLQTLFTKTWEADENLARFLSHLTNIYKSTNILKRLIENTQAERQKEVWSLIEEANSIKDKSEKSESKVNGDVDQGKTEKVRFSFVEEEKELRNSTLNDSKINKTSVSELSLTPESLLGFSLPNMNESWRVIEDNNHLRYRIQEVQQKCNQMVEELSSLNWDFMNDS